jgi:hypothetical protein
VKDTDSYIDDGAVHTQADKGGIVSTVSQGAVYGGGCGLNGLYVLCITSEFSRRIFWNINSLHKNDIPRPCIYSKA